MIIWFGQRQYGRVEVIAGTHIATVFTYAQFMPIAPERSYFVFRDDDGCERFIPIPRHRRSILAAYLRTWGILASIGLVPVVAAFTAGSAWVVPATLAALAFVVGLAYLALTRFGVLSPEERAERVVHGWWTGLPIDPAHLGNVRFSLAGALRAELVGRTGAMMATGYRCAHPAETHHRAIALDPTVTDRDYIAAAFTLARIEESLTPEGAARDAIAGEREALWRKLRAEHPEVLEPEAAHRASPWTSTEPAPDPTPDAVPETAAPPPPAPMGAPPQHVGPVVPPRKSRAPLVGAIVGGAIALASGAAGWFLYTHAKLHVINVSGKDGLSVYLDGEKLLAHAPSASSERTIDDRTFFIRSGAHRLETRDATGEVIDRVDVTFEAGKAGRLYAPAHLPDVCLAVQTDRYWRSPQFAPATKRFQILDRSKSYWQIAEGIDHWFEDTPDEIQLSSRDTGVARRALRVAPCDDPALQE